MLEAVLSGQEGWGGPRPWNSLPIAGTVETFSNT